MGREEFCITCRAADPDCELHYHEYNIAAYDGVFVADYTLKSGEVSVFVPRKHKWVYDVDAKTLYKALEEWRKLA